MAIPLVMSDLSITPASNSPAGSESPTSGDDFLRALGAILRTTNAKGNDIASASTTDIGAATAEFVDVTGTTTITALGTIGAGIRRVVRFTGALTLTHNGTSLILPSSANITTANGDIAEFRSLGSGNWKCTNYIRQNGQVLILGGIATTDITMSSSTMIFSKGADVASAAALPLITDGNYFDVTGTTTITSMNSMGVGVWVRLHFDGALTLTHNATDLILPGGANIITSAGDEADFIEYASGDWRCVSYTRADGKQVIGSLTSGTAITTTSATSHDMTGIPSWVKKITVSFAGLSTNGTAIPIIQLGDAGGIENTGYLGSASTVAGAGTSSTNNSSGFAIASSSSAATVYHGSYTISLLDSATNTWTCSGVTGSSNTTANHQQASSKPLSATLDRLRLTTTNGTDVFDAGLFNIIYE